MPANVFPNYATSSYKGWKLQLTAPHKDEPKWHLSTSWTLPGNPNVPSLAEILSALGTGERSRWHMPAKLAEGLTKAFARVGKVRGTDVRHYYWLEDKPN
jgi:hypothetical protein